MLWRCIIVVVVGSVVLPVHGYYATAYAGLEMSKEAQTVIRDYLLHWGFFLAVALVYLIGECVRAACAARLPSWLAGSAPAIVAAAPSCSSACGWILRRASG